MNTQTKKYYYGDIPEDKAGGNITSSTAKTDWPLWEIFIRSKQGLDHKHVGSLHAADAKMAIQLARDVYTRRQEGTSVWVVRSDHIVASDPAHPFRRWNDACQTPQRGGFPRTIRADQSREARLDPELRGFDEGLEARQPEALEMHDR